MLLHNYEVKFIIIQDVLGHTETLSVSSLFLGGYDRVRFSMTQKHIE